MTWRETIGAAFFALGSLLFTAGSVLLQVDRWRARKLERETRRAA